MDAELFRLPPLAAELDDEGWRTERLRYRVQPRPKSKFKTVLDAHALFGGDEGHSEVTTRVREDGDGPHYVLEVGHSLQGSALRERFECSLDRVASVPGLRPHRLLRELDDADGRPARRKEIHFGRGPFDFPTATYPEVLLPFLMRGQPLDGQRRAAYSWTADRMVARVYYESRGKKKLDVPAGRIEAREVWMYPDLNDWIALGGMLTKLAKPLLPRYSIWFELAPPHRVVRFEGPYGPPAAPEVVLELAG